MLFTKDPKIQNGFCYGFHEITVDRGPRLRLPRAIIQELKQQKVNEIWRYPDPSGRRMILVPHKFRLSYVDTAGEYILEHFSDKEQAYRSYIYSGTSVDIKKHGKISIIASCNKKLQVEEGQRIVILGTGLWYEVWKQSDWLRKEADVIENI